MSNVPTEAQSMSDVSRSQCSHLHTALPLAVGREEPLYTTHCSSLSTLFVNYIVKFIILSFLIFIYSLNKPSMTAKSTLLIKTMQAGSRLITIFPNVTITFQNVTTAQSTGRINAVLHPRSSFARRSRQHNHSGSESGRRGHQHICLSIFMVILHTLFNFQLCSHFLTIISFFTLVQCVGATISWQRNNFPAAMLLLFRIKPR